MLDWRCPTPYPTIDELEIYKSPLKLFQVQAAVRIDYPVFTSPFEDNFTGDALDETLWDKKLPTWGLMTVAGGTILIGSLGGSISPAWMSSKANLAFPRTKTADWLLETRVRFPWIEGFGEFFRICTLENAKAAFAVKCNSADGLSIEAPDESTDLWNVPFANPSCYDWYKYTVAYSARAQTYTINVYDEFDAYVAGPFTITAVGYQADYIVVGNSTARQGQLGGWTHIEVDYVRVTGTSEAFEVPIWAHPGYLHDAVTAELGLWSYLPSMLRGDVTFNKDNQADALNIDLLNFSHGYDPADPLWRLYNGFSFSNRPIMVYSRVSDGRNWTAWRLIFKGSCDEKNTELRNGECILTVSARDIYRKRLMDTHLVRAYADYYSAVPIDGLFCQMYVGQIIEDIVEDAVGLPEATFNIVDTPWNIPKTFNIGGESAADAIQRLMDDTVLCWYPRLSDFQIQVKDWSWGTDTPLYTLSTAEEVETISWTESAMDALAILELNVENTEFMDGGFSTNYPHAPTPFRGASTFESAVTSQGYDPDLVERPIHYLRWKRANRGLGSLTLTTHCQDWVEHDLELSVVDDKFLGIKPTDGPWVVDGWSHSWEGTSEFTTTINVINQHPDRTIRRSLREDL